VQFAKSKVTHPSSGDFIDSPNHNFRRCCTVPLGCQLLDFRRICFSAFLDGSVWEYILPVFLSSFHAYAEAKELKHLLTCIYNMSLFLIQGKTEVIENPALPPSESGPVLPCIRSHNHPRILPVVPPVSPELPRPPTGYRVRSGRYWQAKEILPPLRLSLVIPLVFLLPILAFLSPIAP